MQTAHHADGVTDLVRQFVHNTGAVNDTAETTSAKLIAAVLHWTMKAGEMDGDDGRKVALAAARRGLSSFISDVHRIDGEPRAPECYTLITVRTEEGLWVSETGFEELVE